MCLQPRSREAQRASGTRQGSSANQPCQHVGRFQDSHATASVIVGAGPLVIQMTAVNYFARGRVGASNDSAYHCPVSGPTASPWHAGRSALRAQPCPQRLSGVARNHEGESSRLARVQVAPTHYGAIQT